MEGIQPLLDRVNFVNIRTQCTKESLKRAEKSLDIESVLLHILNSTVLDGNGDGIVGGDSQKRFSNFAKQEYVLETSHQGLLSNGETARSIARIIEEPTITAAREQE